MVVTDTDWEDFDDFDNFGISICTSSTRPTAHEGRHIYETDTNKTLRYTGAAWDELAGGGGVTDHGALTGLADDDHTQYLLVNGTREMTGNLDMGANNVYLDSGVLRISDGTGLSGSIGFTTGVQNFIQRQLYSGADYTLLSDQDYMHTWAILGTENMHLSTVDGLKMYTKINMNGIKIEGVLDPTADQEAATKKYVDDNGITWSDQSFQNISKNGSFESWSAGTAVAPDGWTGYDSPTIARESSTIKKGSYSAKITATTNASRLAHLYNSTTEYSDEEMTVGCLVWSDHAGACIALQYSGSTAFSDYHTGSSSWEWLKLKYTNGSGSINKWAILYPDRLNGTGIAYFDGVMLVKGSVCPAFSPRPLYDDGESIQIDPTTNSVTIGRDPTIDAEAATKKYVDDNSGAGDFLADGTVPMTGNIDMDDNDIVDANAIQATASQDLTLKVSTGQSIIFQAV